MPVKIIIALTLSFVLTYLFLLFSGNTYITPYIFKPAQKVTPQAFVDYLFVRVFYAVLATVISMLVKEFYPAFAIEFTIVAWLFCLYILDYWLFYNDPMSKIYGIPFSYSLIMGVILITLTVEIVIKWYSLK
jgi:hypothetical protein